MSLSSLVEWCRCGGGADDGVTAGVCGGDGRTGGDADGDHDDCPDRDEFADKEDGDE